MTDTRPRCPYCRRLGPVVCRRCREIVRALFPPDCAEVPIIEPRHKRQPERRSHVPAAPLARWLNSKARSHSVKSMARVLSERFGTDPDRERRQLERICGGHVQKLEAPTADRILVGLNGPSASGLYGGEW